MNTLIVIPARYGSTRLPGKPLMMIAGQTLLARVVEIARRVAQNDPSIRTIVATDDARIGSHADELGIPWAMTPATCPTGTDRVWEAAKAATPTPDFIINLQGDAPLTPPDFLTAMIDSFRATPCDVITPVVRLMWTELDALREAKQTTPFSGTTATFDEKTGRAHWFSKTILPAIRKEASLREASPYSPVWRHIGLYGYSREMLARFVALPEGVYEKLEGLEQLRVLEHGHQIRCIPVDYRGRPASTGVDSPEDIARVEALL